MDQPPLLLLEVGQPTRRHSTDAGDTGESANVASCNHSHVFQ